MLLAGLFVLIWLVGWGLVASVTLGYLVWCLGFDVVVCCGFDLV